MPHKNAFAFSRINFILLGISLATIILGFILMSGKGSDEPPFTPAIFDPRRIVVAPMVCLLGYLFMIVAILYRPKHEAGEVKPSTPDAE